MPHSETAYNVEVETVQAKEMAKIAYHALDEKKGEDIRIIDIAGISVLADYFIIANGSSESQVQAMVDNVEEEMHKAGYSLKQREGYGSGNWVLLDFGDVIVHVFDKENRLFYDLERIWRDGKNIEITELS
ncbi:ribosome silencing factor [Mediterraneibacter glycyrrhizinilyticus]|uniref:ribosome silencing factor n=1 Tax=Mediterraneibacter glycyrrhizinilyticus TaxID=342942 RepID=UPI001D07A3BF|nr:ribosome silencing factor [Mediterraneibacter glycyrrhizinilyticus]MCB6308626.1 ribosome silencing factor [Lachnospiraceae bacterium 210521-DFI.1.109]MCB6426810.1 ribosome silencing factor [Mediterraneibacter glycyrrhizinilyticus]